MMGLKGSIHKMQLSSLEIKAVSYSYFHKHPLLHPKLKYLFYLNENILKCNKYRVLNINPEQNQSYFSCVSWNRDHPPPTLPNAHPELQLVLTSAPSLLSQSPAFWVNPYLEGISECNKNSFKIIWSSHPKEK